MAPEIEMGREFDEVRNPNIYTAFMVHFNHNDGSQRAYMIAAAATIDSP